MNDTKEIVEIINSDPELAMKYRLKFLERRIGEAIPLLFKLSKEPVSDEVKKEIAAYLDKFGVKCDCGPKPV